MFKLFSLTSRLRQLCKRKEAVQRFAFILDNGRYIVRGASFVHSEDTRIHLQDIPKTVTVYSEKKNACTYRKGRLHISYFKAAAIFPDCVYYSPYARDNYISIRDRIKTLYDRLPYDACTFAFDDEHTLMRAPFVKGQTYRDEEHFQKVLDYCFGALAKAELTERTIDIAGTERSVYYCVQHGDLNTRNILWNDDRITLIDLDNISILPLFYDIFYFVMTSRSADAFAYFHTSAFADRILAFCRNRGIHTDEDVIDLYLAAFADIHIQRITEKTRMFDVQFYLGRFMNADLSGFPMTQAKILTVPSVLKQFGIQ